MLQLLLLEMKPKLKLCAVCEAGSDAALYCCEAGSVLLYLSSNMPETLSASSGCKTAQYCAEGDV